MAADAGNTLRGKVVIGCYSSLAPTLLTELMAEYGNRHPDVELDFFAGTQQEIHEKLLSGELDLAIAYELTVPAGLARKRLREAVPAVVLPADHRLAARERVALAELVDEPMILLDVNPSRENTEMMFSAAGLTPWIRFRTTDFDRRADPRPGRRPGPDDERPGAVPGAADGDRLHGRLPRHPHRAARVPGRLRDPGAQPQRAADRAGDPGRDRAVAVLRRVRERGLPGGVALRPPRPARRGPRDRAHRAPGDALRDPPAGGASRRPPAAQRLHRPAEGRRADRDHRGHRRGVPRRPDRRLDRLQLHAHGRGGAALSRGDDPARPAARALGGHGGGDVR